VTNMTSEHVAQLTALFATRDHEFNPNGFCYLSEEAITARLDEVDPNWSFRVTQTVQRDARFITYAALTVCGVTRENAGMADAEVSTKSGKEVGEAEKSAVTDAFKRCARLFGIGRYILTIPKGISDTRALNVWLKEAAGTAQPADAPAQAPAAPPRPVYAPSKPAAPAKAQPAPDGYLGLFQADTIQRQVGKNGKPYIRLSSSLTDENAVLFTREPIRALGQAWADFAENLHDGDKINLTDAMRAELIVETSDGKVVGLKAKAL